jgi:hypothetical protein
MNIKSTIVVSLMTLFIAFSMSSCKKNEGNNTEDLKEYARVNLEFLTDQGNPVSARLKSFAATTASIENPFASQHVSIPLDEGTILSATLEYVEPERDLSSSLKASALASTGPLKQASVVNSPLVAGIKYRLVAYTADGDYVKDLVFTSGDESETNFTLDAGEEYHFVCYSVNSTSFVPECDKNNLFTAKLETALSDYFETKGSPDYDNHRCQPDRKHFCNQWCHLFAELQRSQHRFRFGEYELYRKYDEYAGVLSQCRCSTDYQFTLCHT